MAFNSGSLADFVCFCAQYYNLCCFLVFNVQVFLLQWLKKCTWVVFTQFTSMLETTGLQFTITITANSYEFNVHRSVMILQLKPGPLLETRMSERTNNCWCH